MSLTWEVFLAPSLPAIAPDVPPGETARPWPPISSTLISGERDAVLVDTAITVEQSRDDLRHPWPWRSLRVMPPTTAIICISQSRQISRSVKSGLLRLVVQATTARELYDEMLKLYPDWINRGALWTSVRAVKP